MTSVDIQILATDIDNVPAQVAGAIGGAILADAMFDRSVCANIVARAGRGRAATGSQGRSRMPGIFDELFSLTGRTAVVTGGSSGIGKAMAGVLGQAGASVVVVARGREQLRETVREMTADGGKASYVAVDLADREAVRQAVEEMCEPFGEPDILVNAAGINLRPHLEQLSVEDWDRSMEVNLNAPFMLGQRFGPRMAERGWGRILNIGSQQSVRAFGNSGVYGVSKAGVLALTRTQAEAWSSRGVCCNAVVPGFVPTAMTSAVNGDPARLAALAARTMSGRNGTPGDFRGITLFLAGPASDYVTGQSIFVDGGFSTH